MSAYMVDAETIHVLVHAAINLDRSSPLHWRTTAEPNAEGTNGVRTGMGTGYRVAENGAETHIGQMLLDANAASLDARYGDDDAFVYAYHRPRHTDWEPVELLGILNCFEYQTCEIPEWLTSEAFGFCYALRRAIERRLPGASEAPWGVGPEDMPAHVEKAREARAQRRRG